MITDNDQYVFVKGYAPDASHPHGDLDRIVHDGKLLPERGASVLYGQDIAWLVECIEARKYLVGIPYYNEHVFQRINRGAYWSLPLISEYIQDSRDLIRAWNALFDVSSSTFCGQQVPSTRHRASSSFPNAYSDIIWGHGQYAWKLDVPLTGVILKRRDLETMLTSFSSAFLSNYCSVHIPEDEEEPDDNLFWARIHGSQTQLHTSGGSRSDPGPYVLSGTSTEYFDCTGSFSPSERQWNFIYQWSYRSTPQQIRVHIPEKARRVIKSFRIACGMDVYYSFMNEDGSSGGDGGTSWLISPLVVVGSQNDYIVNVSFDDGITNTYGIDRRSPSYTPPGGRSASFSRYVSISIADIYIIANLKDSHTNYR